MYLCDEIAKSELIIMKTIHPIISILVLVAALTVGCQRTQVSQVSNPDDIKNYYQQVLTAANESPDSAMLMVDFEDVDAKTFELRAGLTYKL